MGKCKFCRIPISFRYPAIELLTALLALALYLKFSLTPALGFWFAFTCALIVISFIDLDHQIIPDMISLPGILIFASSFYFLPEMTLLKTGLGILAGGGILYAAALIYYLVKKQEGMGGGDIKLLAMIGAATGVKGVFFIIFCASLAGSLIGGIVMLVSKNADRRLRIPFGPFLSFGAMIYIFFGKELIGWYLGFLTG